MVCGIRGRDCSLYYATFFTASHFFNDAENCIRIQLLESSRWKMNERTNAPARLTTLAAANINAHASDKHLCEHRRNRILPARDLLSSLRAHYDADSHQDRRECIRRSYIDPHYFRPPCRDAPHQEMSKRNIPRVLEFNLTGIPRAVFLFCFCFSFFLRQYRLK